MLVLGLLLAAAPARADDQGPSPDTALALAGGITGGGAVLVVPGVLLAPSHPAVGLTMAFTGAAAFLMGPAIGHAYAGDHDMPFGAALEIAGGTMLPAALLVGWAECGADKDHSQGCTPTIAETMLIAGGAAVVTGIVWDLATVRAAARRHRVALGPWRVEGGGGVALAGRF